MGTAVDVRSRHGATSHASSRAIDRAGRLWTRPRIVEDKSPFRLRESHTNGKQFVPRIIVIDISFSAPCPVGAFVEPAKERVPHEFKDSSLYVNKRVGTILIDNLTNPIASAGHRY